MYIYYLIKNKKEEKITILIDLIALNVVLKSVISSPEEDLRRWQINKFLKLKLLSLDIGKLRLRCD